MSELPTPVAHPKARAEVETYIVPDGTCFLYDVTNDASYVLDQLGALVWDYCDGLTSSERIVNEVVELLPAQADAEARTRALLAEFAEEGLLETREALVELDLTARDSDG